MPGFPRPGHIFCMTCVFVSVKMGALMSENSGRLLGLYDELSAFLAQINLYRGRGLSDSHELAMFLQLYNGHQWRRDTGKKCAPTLCIVIAIVCTYIYTTYT